MTVTKNAIIVAGWQLYRRVREQVSVIAASSQAKVIMYDILTNTEAASEIQGGPKKLHPFSLQIAITLFTLNQLSQFLVYIHYRKFATERCRPIVCSHNAVCVTTLTIADFRTFVKKRLCYF